MIWLYSISTWLLGTLVVGLVILLTNVGLLCLRPVVKKHLVVSNDVVFGFMGATGIIYALILGLIAVANWESLNRAEEYARAEAEQVEKVDRDLAAFPTDQAIRVRAVLMEYLHNVIDKEWPMQRAGIEIPRNPLVDRISAEWISLELKTDTERAMESEGLSQLNQLYSYRRSRVQQKDTALPAALWYVVLLGGALNLLLAYLVTGLSLRSHIALTTIFAATVGLMIFMIIAVDHPMWGSLSVSPDSYKGVLKILEARDQK